MKLNKILAALLLAAASAELVQADFTVTGTFLYRDRAFSYNSGFTGSEPTLPVRQAEVQVRDATSGTILGTGTTDDNGDFSIFVTGSGLRNINVRCQSQSRLYGIRRIRVRTTSSVLYSVDSTTFSSWDQSVDLDVGTTIAEKIFQGSFQANPWNMLDLGVYAIDYILAQGESNPTGDVNIEWPGGGGSFASGFRANISDDDGYDDMVILHELGHVFHNMYSDSDSPGGFHTFGDSDQDPRLSYGEGWATFFAGAVRQYMGIFDPAYYMDADGTSGGGVQLRARLENATPYSSSTAGEANEVGIACVLWDIIDTTATNDGNATDDDALDGSVLFNGGIDGDQMQWDSFSGPVSSASSLTINDHWNGFFSPTNHGNFSQLQAVFNGFEIRNTLDAEEPNNSTITATPIRGDNTWRPIKTPYYAANNPAAPGENDSDFYSLHLDAGNELTVETRYPNGDSNARTYVDPYVRLQRPNGSIFASNDNGGTGRNALLPGLIVDTTGTWTIQVTTLHSYRETGSYQLRVERTGNAITSVTPSTIPAISNPSVTIDIEGLGFNAVSGVTMDGVALAPFVFGSGSFEVISDSLIRIHEPALMTKLGIVDIVLDTGGASDPTAQITVVEAIAPVLATSTPTAFEHIGIDVSVGSPVGDKAFVVMSFINSPSAFPPYTTLDIGANWTNYSVVVNPFIPAKGYETFTSGPLTQFGLSGFTMYWQVFALPIATAGQPPWPTSNVITTTIF